MEKEIKIEAGKQYLKYFRIWFVLAGILTIAAIVCAIGRTMTKESVRGNVEAPAERVYDYAEVLSESQENALRELITQTQELIAADIVLVTTNVVMQNSGDYFGDSWEVNMRNAADDFYDQNGFGYDTIKGDGVLILDNWYEGQAGSWLSTSGKMVDKFSQYETDQVLDEIYYEIEYGNGAYEAYRKAIQEIGKIAQGGLSFISKGTYYLIAVVISSIIALIYTLSKLANKEGEKTIVAGTYVEGSPVVNVQTDQFIRSMVTRRKIPRQNPQTAGGRSVSGGGVHRSSSGTRHGGGGRRR